MRASLEFLIGLLEGDDPIGVAQEDFSGAHGEVLRTAQGEGFLSREPDVNPAASCPHCEEGVPYRLGVKFICASCRSEVAPENLWLWRLDREAFLAWVAAQMRLRGGVRRVGERLWQLGTVEMEGEILECFYRRGGPSSEREAARLAAYRSVLVLHGLTPPLEADRRGGGCVSLVELLRMDGALAVTDLRPLLRVRGNVRFDAHSGGLWLGDACLGEVPLGSKECYFLDCLTREHDHFVTYADIKRFVLRRSGSSDETEEATFCQGLKSRIKKKWVQKIDLLIATTNKADGYRLRAYVDL